MFNVQRCFSSEFLVRLAQKRDLMALCWNCLRSLAKEKEFAILKRSVENGTGNSPFVRAQDESSHAYLAEEGDTYLALQGGRL